MPADSPSFYGRTLRGRHSEMERGHGAEQAHLHHGDGETSRDFCYVANAVQANLLAATTENPEAVNQLYNVATGERTTLNELFEMLKQRLLPHYPQLKELKPVYRDFRAGDVRHSQADISKARRLLGYEPSIALNRA